MSTQVTLLDAQGKAKGSLTEEAMEASAVLIDCGGFGVRVMLDRPRPVSRGRNDTVMIHLTDRRGRYPFLTGWSPSWSSAAAAGRSVAANLAAFALYLDNHHPLLDDATILFPILKPPRP